MKSLIEIYCSPSCICKVCRAKDSVLVKAGEFATYYAESYTEQDWAYQAERYDPE